MTNQTVENTSEKMKSASRDAPPWTAHQGATHAPARSGRASKAKDLLQTLSMAIPVVGALGTLFVWCAANLYVGDIEVLTDKPSPDLVVNVYNQKGQATAYHVNKFQLMPGIYHIEIMPDGKSKIPADIDVKFHALNRLVVHWPELSKLAAYHLPPSVAPASSPAAQKNAPPEMEVQTQEVQAQDPAPARPSDQEVFPLEPVEASTLPTKNAMPTLPKPAADNQATEERKESNSEDSQASLESQEPKDGAHRWWQLWHKKQ